MIAQIRPAVVLLLLLSVTTGLVYPAVVTAIAAVVFPRQATGSMIERDGKAVGSDLIAQPFSEPKYFRPRPSAAGYNAASSGGSNLGPTAPALKDAVQQRIGDLRAADPGNHASIPVDLVTASASGLDPHISPAAARYQVARVARARNRPETEIQSLVDRFTESRTFGILGEPRINVLRLNLALDGN